MNTGLESLGMLTETPDADLRFSANGLSSLDLPDPRTPARDEALLALDGKSIESIKRVLASAGFPSSGESAELDGATRSALANNCSACSSDI